MSKYWKGVWIVFTVVITTLLVNAEVRLHRLKRVSDEVSSKYTGLLRGFDSTVAYYQDQNKKCEERYNSSNERHNRLIREIIDFNLQKQMRRDAIKVLEEEASGSTTEK